MRGWLSSAGSGPHTWMLSSATSTAWITLKKITPKKVTSKKIEPQQRKGRQGEKNDLSRSVHAGPGQRGAGTKGRREVDAHSRQRAAPRTGKSLGGAYRPGASARVGALRCRWEPGRGWKHCEAHLGGNAHVVRSKSDASGGS